MKISSGSSLLISFCNNAEQLNANGLKYMPSLFAIWYNFTIFKIDFGKITKLVYRMYIMEKYVYKIIGFLFLTVSAILFTSERIADKISAAIVDAGYATRVNGVGQVPFSSSFSLFDNFFVWFFFFVGLIILAFDSLKKR